MFSLDEITIVKYIPYWASYVREVYNLKNIPTTTCTLTLSHDIFPFSNELWQSWFCQIYRLALWVDNITSFFVYIASCSLTNVCMSKGLELHITNIEHAIRNHFKIKRSGRSGCAICMCILSFLQLRK